jgi:hypothetical protein
MNSPNQGVCIPSFYHSNEKVLQFSADGVIYLHVRGEGPKKHKAGAWCSGLVFLDSLV